MGNHSCKDQISGAEAQAASLASEYAALGTGSCGTELTAAEAKISSLNSQILLYQNPDSCSGNLSGMNSQISSYEAAIIAAGGSVNTGMGAPPNTSNPSGFANRRYKHHFATTGSTGSGSTGSGSTGSGSTISGSGTGGAGSTVVCNAQILASVNAANASLASQYATLSGESSSLSSGLGSINSGENANINILTSNLTGIQQAGATLTNASEGATNDCSVNLSSMLSNIQSSGVTLGNLLATNTSLNSAATTSSQYLAASGSYSGILSGMNNTLNGYQTQITSYNTSGGSLQGDFNGLSTQIANLTTPMINMSSSLSAASGSIEACSGSVISAKKLSGSYAGTMSDYTNSTGSLAVASGNQATALGSYNIAKDTYDKYSEAVTQISASIKSLESNIAAYEASASIQLNLTNVIYPFMSAYNWTPPNSYGNTLTTLSGSDSESVASVYTDYMYGGSISADSIDGHKGYIGTAGVNVTASVMQNVAAALYSLVGDAAAANISGQSKCNPFTNYVATANVSIDGTNYTYNTWSKS